MSLLQLLVIIAVLVACVAVAVGWLPGGLDRAESTLPDEPLPEGTLTARDLRLVRFNQTLRGYRMSEVDELLDRLSAQLVQAEARALAAVEPSGYGQPEGSTPPPPAGEPA